MDDVLPIGSGHSAAGAILRTRPKREQNWSLNLPHQQRVVEEMQKSLQSPRHSVSRDFVEVLAFNRARLDHPELFARSNTDWWNEEWEADAKARNEAFLSAMAQATEDLLVALPKIQAPAQRDSLGAVLDSCPRGRPE